MSEKEIPKVIHYCWFGHNELPSKYKKYINSWKKYCPDYKIIEWNEDNFDVTQNKYCHEAYKSKKWAFVSDYARLKIIYENGGIYLDTDVELIKPLDPIIDKGIGFIGFQNTNEINTGLGFAAAKHNVCVEMMLNDYNNRAFILDDNKFNLTPCPAINTHSLMKHGLKIGLIASKNIQKLPGLNVYPVDFFNPYNRDTMKLKITDNTYSIHQYAATWFSSESKKKQRLKKFIPNMVLNLRVLLIARRDIDNIKKELEKTNGVK